MSKHCVSCGMPLEKPEDFAIADISKDHCTYCSNPDGTLKTYEQVLEGLTGLIMSRDGLSETDARSAAKGIMASLPAWKKVPGC